MWVVVALELVLKRVRNHIPPLDRVKGKLRFSLHRFLASIFPGVLRGRDRAG